MSSQENAGVQFYTFGLAAAGSRFAGHAKSASKLGLNRAVKTVTLEGLPALSEGPDLIKVDVEGAESEVLQGVGQGLLGLRPHFLVEVHSPPELGMMRNAGGILDWCAHTGYRPYYLAGKCFLHTPEPLSSRGRCHLLLLPKDSPLPAWASALPKSASLEAAASFMAAAG